MKILVTGTAVFIGLHLAKKLLELYHEVIDFIFKDIGLYTIGRFGEWEYYNMGICMESAMKLVSKIDGK
ncbi:hypothetical protein HOK00_07580 [bacterium]|jgi:hypothetical protein|nr:hypothetical protein [bacterium]